MQKLLLLGDEAIAQGGIDAGISGIFAYPGTPSTEITEYVQGSSEAASKGIRSRWAANEKTAMEAALGMSYAGKRALVAMKHVGLNVAADAFINSGITGVNGGLVVVAADDPSMHSSQNEQDSRFFGKFAMVPMLEPGNQQEAYEMTHYGFELSEKYQIPVLLRITTRLAHSRAGVARKQAQPQNELKLPSDPRQFVLLPGIARKRYKMLLANQEKFEKESVNSPFNDYIEGKDKSLGIIAAGLSYNYLVENYKDGKLPYPVLKLSQYPLPDEKVKKLADETDTLLILEEGAPVIEELMRGFMDAPLTIRGRMDGTLPRDGELNPNLVARALGLEEQGEDKVPDLISDRPPKLCAGCPHIDSYKALNEVLKDYGDGFVFSDIGCYTLGALPPYNSINSCVDMGASVTMAKGAADAGLHPSVTVIGDSTFTHSGITGLLDAVNDKVKVTIFILDNDTTAMTGGQDSSATGRLESICEGVGVSPEHIRVIRPLKKHHEENVQIIREEIEYDGVSVIIPRRECIVAVNKRNRAKFNNKNK
ncbi:MAG: thiamine pyrophosphate-dependent enzyme [Bacteroidales bacterium]